MGKRLEISDMPPLTVEVHSELRLLERKLQNALGEQAFPSRPYRPHMVETFYLGCGRYGARFWALAARSKLFLGDAAGVVRDEGEADAVV